MTEQEIITRRTEARKSAFATAMRSLVLDLMQSEDCMLEFKYLVNLHHEMEKKERLHMNTMEQLLFYLGDTIGVNLDLRGGVPCIKGTRIPVAQLLASIMEGETIKEFADEYDIPEQPMIEFMDRLSIFFNQPFAEKEKKTEGK